MSVARQKSLKAHARQVGLAARARTTSTLRMSSAISRDLSAGPAYVAGEGRCNTNEYPAPQATSERRNPAVVVLQATRGSTRALAQDPALGLPARGHVRQDHGLVAELGEEDRPLLPRESVIHRQDHLRPEGVQPSRLDVGTDAARRGVQVARLGEQATATPCSRPTSRQPTTPWSSASPAHRAQAGPRPLTGRVPARSHPRGHCSSRHGRTSGGSGGGRAGRPRVLRTRRGGPEARASGGTGDVPHSGPLTAPGARCTFRAQVGV